MRVFKSSNIISSTQPTGGKDRKQASRRRLSQSEVQAKIEKLKVKKHGEEVVAKKKANAKRTQTSQFMNGGILNQKRFPNAKIKQEDLPKVPQENEIEYESPNTEDYTLSSDVAKNDPNSDVTKEKLRSLLTGGGFSFNPKEREVLSKILGE